MAFEHIEDGLPIAGRTFHGDMGHPQIGEPLAQQHQVRSHGAKRAPLFVPLAVAVRKGGTPHNRSLVDIESRARLVDDVPLITPSSNGRVTRCPSWDKFSLACFPYGERQTVVLVGHPGSHCWSGSQREYQTDL
jgi:hypothetical protein